MSKVGPSGCTMSRALGGTRKPVLAMAAWKDRETGRQNTQVPRSQPRHDEVKHTTRQSTVCFEP